MFLKNWFKKAKPVESKFGSTIKELKSLDLERLNTVFSSDMSIHQVTVYKKTIGEYIQLLEQLIESIEHDKLLYPIQLPQELVTVFLHDFYLDSNRNYIDPVEMTKRFVNTATAFLELWEVKEQEPEKTFILEKNLYLTQQYVGNINLLVKGLSNG